MRQSNDRLQDEKVVLNTCSIIMIIMGFDDVCK